MFFAAKDGEALQSEKIRLVADCGSYHELLIAKLGLKLKKVGKTTRPFRYDLNQILYDYTVEVRNIFKGLDLIEPDELWTEVHNIVQNAVMKTIPKGKKMQKDCLRRPYKQLRKEEKLKGKKEKKRYIHLNAEFQRIVHSLFE